MTSAKFTQGQVIKYRVCASVYVGTIVKVKNNSLVIIDHTDKAAVELHLSGVALGDEIAFNQVID